MHNIIQKLYDPVRERVQQAPSRQHRISEKTLGTMNLLSPVLRFSLHMKN